MASTEQLSLIRRDVKDWNSWRKNNSLIIVDLSNADLSRLDLTKASLWDANLEGANLEGSNLNKSDFRGANCKNVNLSQANLSESDLRNANFTQANLLAANLTQANLGGAILTLANLFQANLTGAILTAACIYNWRINRQIILRDINCNHVYLGPNKLNRYPEEGNFQPGEFRQLIEKDFITETITIPDLSPISLDVFDQLEQLNSTKVEEKNHLETAAMTITDLIYQATEDIPESPTRHVKVAARVVNSLQNNSDFLNQFKTIKADNKLEDLEALIPNPAAKLIIIALKK